MPSARMPSPLLLHGNSCLEHLHPALNQPGGSSNRFFRFDLEGTGRRVKRGVGAEGGWSEIHRLSPLEVPGAGWTAAAALKPAQLVQTGGAACPVELRKPLRYHHRRSPPCPEPREPGRVQPPAPALPAGAERKRGGPSGGPATRVASAPGTSVPPRAG